LGEGLLFSLCVCQKKDYALRVKLKSVTLTFKHWFSETGFGELTVPGFRFVASASHDLPLTFGILG
jgi:hypothetical protein